MDYVPRKRADEYVWLKQLSGNVVAEAVKIGAPPADATAVKGAADDLIAKMEATDAASNALDGARQNEATAQAADIAVIRGFVRKWKTLDGYPASGSEAVLGLKGTEPAFVPSDYKPVITVKIEAGKIRIDFLKGGIDSLALYARLRGTLGWLKIGVDTYPPYFDTRPLAQAGVPEAREYMARGMIGDEEIGLDSDIVSIVFGG